MATTFTPSTAPRERSFAWDRALDFRFGSKADIIRSVRGCFTSKSGHAQLSRRLRQEAA